ncbi:carbohydrate-binding family 9-like protein [Cohnella sp. AR92]|uniref:carbohydrate-binding family 9-like protein n=1 Tax=Cohnella sp. AR92 TaxID=648716 RepID=UPI000F8DA44C|nr:carbohydrate-binding family 9-like protein [Cohnella sp. AR92]RUS45121.1 hypothetical protein ELR57_21560 [Cohnella sp. AR92]
MDRYEIPYRSGAIRKEGGDLPPLAVDRLQWLDADNPPETHVRVSYDEEALDVRFRVFEENPTVRYAQDASPVYEDSCVEFFLQPLPGEDARYLNFEWNAAGALLLQIGEGREARQPVGSGGSLFGVRAQAGLSDPASGRAYWELAFRIPFAFLRQWFPGFRTEPGVRMRGNFYKCGDRTPQPHYLSWQAVSSERPDFHRSDCFGELAFGSRKPTIGE